jgi:hypothetical protein
MPIKMEIDMPTFASPSTSTLCSFGITLRTRAYGFSIFLSSQVLFILATSLLVGMGGFQISPVRKLVGLEQSSLKQT